MHGILQASTHQQGKRELAIQIWQWIKPHPWRVRATAVVVSLFSWFTGGRVPFTKMSTATESSPAGHHGAGLMRNTWMAALPLCSSVYSIANAYQRSTDQSFQPIESTRLNHRLHTTKHGLNLGPARLSYSAKLCYTRHFWTNCIQMGKQLTMAEKSCGNSGVDHSARIIHAVLSAGFQSLFCHHYPSRNSCWTTQPRQLRRELVSCPHTAAPAERILCVACDRQHDGICNC